MWITSRVMLFAIIVVFKLNKFFFRYPTNPVSGRIVLPLSKAKLVRAESFQNDYNIILHQYCNKYSILQCCSPETSGLNESNYVCWIFFIPEKSHYFNVSRMPFHACLLEWSHSKQTKMTYILLSEERSLKEPLLICVISLPNNDLQNKQSCSFAVKFYRLGMTTAKVFAPRAQSRK